jgi:beta-amylase
LIEINISLGPTGELRYPAYNESDGWQYPDRGNFQAYSRLAQENFRDWAIKKYGDLSGVSQHWGIALGSRADIRVPGGELPAHSVRRAQAFVDAYDYQDTPYGRDFIDWYHESLVDHGKRVLLAADTALDGPMKSIPLGMKIPGIHWQLQCTPHPRIAEVTAGLIPTSLNQRSRQPDAFGYRRVMEMIAEVKRATQRDVILHFTALEMDNDAPCGIGNGGTSMAAALVLWVSQAAGKHGITHRGKNALGCVGDEDLNTDGNRSWERIGNAFTFTCYSGFTFLRLTRRPHKGCVPWNAVDKERYRTFIQRNVSLPPIDETHTCGIGP